MYQCRKLDKSNLMILLSCITITITLCNLLFMEKGQEFQRVKVDPHRRTEYSRGSGAFGIEFGRPVKLPNLKKTILNTSRQELEDRQKKFLSLEKDKQNSRNRNKILPRFTSQQATLAEQQKSELLPKINNKMMKQTSAQRLQRIKSEQNIINQNFELIGTYRVGGVIGKGSYASVRLVKSWKGGVFAMKIYDKQKTSDPSHMNNIRNQIKVMQSISHPNIIKYYETIYTNQSINIIMQLVQNNSLIEYLRMQPNKKAMEENARIIMKDLLKALEYLHGKNFVHRDIKLENILISKDMRIKLIDFGFSTSDSQIHYDFCGTPHYISPEIISKGGYTGQAADIWATGIVMYKLLTGTFPFKGLNDKILYRKICRGQWARPTEVSQGAVEMIEKMLAMDASERPSAGELLRGGWINATNGGGDSGGRMEEEESM